MQINRAIRFIVLAMLGFGLMALFTREANAPIVTIATWRAIIGPCSVWAVVAEGTAKCPQQDTGAVGIPMAISCWPPHRGVR